METYPIGFFHPLFPSLVKLAANYQSGTTYSRPLFIRDQRLPITKGNRGEFHPPRAFPPFFPVKTLCGPDPFPPRHRTRLLSLYKHEVRFPADGSSRLQRPLFQTWGWGGWGEGEGLLWRGFRRLIRESHTSFHGSIFPFLSLSLSVFSSLSALSSPSSSFSFFRGINRRRMRPVLDWKLKIDSL